MVAFPPHLPYGSKILSVCLDVGFSWSISPGMRFSTSDLVKHLHSHIRSLSLSQIYVTTVLMYFFPWHNWRMRCSPTTSHSLLWFKGTSVLLEQSLSLTHHPRGRITLLAHLWLLCLSHRSGFFLRNTRWLSSLLSILPFCHLNCFISLPSPLYFESDLTCLRCHYGILFTIPPRFFP